MQNKISYYVRIFILDHEYIVANETKTIENRGLFSWITQERLTLYFLWVNAEVRSV